MKRLSPKNVDYYFLLILAAGAILGGIGAFLEIGPLAVIGMVLMFGDIIFRLVCYRCPHCGKYLDRSKGDYCPYCGESMNQ